MAEVYSWPEGQIALWTGTATASAMIGYATDLQLVFDRKFINRRTLSGSYYNLESDKLVSVGFGQMMTNSLDVWKIFQSATAVHMRLNHSAYPNGSAGFYLYSGVLTNVTLGGTEGGVYKYNVSYYANEWSGYG